jgi:nuclear protein 1
MSEAHFDEYEHYNYTQEKYMNGRSGKQRTKKEAAEHTNHHDPNGHVRKLVTKMVNTEQNQREQRIKHNSGPKEEKPVASKS